MWSAGAPAGANRIRTGTRSLPPRCGSYAARVAAVRDQRDETAIIPASGALGQPSPALRITAMSRGSDRPHRRGDMAPRELAGSPALPARQVKLGGHTFR